MNETLNSLRPYNYCVDEEMRYTFITDEGIVYHAYFLDYSMFMPQFSNIYMFNIEPEDETAHPIDIRITHTIIKILAKFFESNVNTMIMVCDNLDGKEHKRNMLFDRWYQKYGTSEIDKFDASAETEDYMLYVSLFIHKMNPERKRIVNAFYDLVKNNMYPTD